MQFKLPKNDHQVIWTRHAVSKMRQYGLTEVRLRRLIRHYQRREKGIVPGTMALMQPAGSLKHPNEIWLMYQEVPLGNKIKVITAWRYPGISKKQEKLPIPEEIIKELKNGFE